MKTCEHFTGYNVEYIYQVSVRIDAGAYIITIHEECKEDIREVFDYIRSKGCKVGISINPPTSLDKIKKYIDEVDMVLIMSVNPGYAGQAFIP